LTELEGLADLLNAETEMQRKLALRQAEVYSFCTDLRNISENHANVYEQSREVYDNSMMGGVNNSSSAWLSQKRL
jgi:tRNA U34 5-carboxymethylaminomethyl modifying GTPase MnmE/TrmE